MLHSTGVDLWPKVFNHIPHFVGHSDWSRGRHMTQAWPIRVSWRYWYGCGKLVSGFEIAGCQYHVSLELLGALLLPPRTKLRINPKSRQEEPKEKKGEKESETQRQRGTERRSCWHYLIACTTLLQSFLNLPLLTTFQLCEPAGYFFATFCVNWIFSIYNQKSQLRKV